MPGAIPVEVLEAEAADSAGIASLCERTLGPRSSVIGLAR